MQTPSRSIRPLAAAAALLIAAPSFAGVTVSRTTRSDGFRGMGAFEAQSIESYDGTNKREETKTKYKGAVMGRLAGGDQVTIVRVADDKVIMIDPKRKSYRESTISRAAQEMEKAKKQQESAGQKDKDSKPTHRVTKAEFKVTPANEKKTINGFPCEHFKAVMLIEVESIETKQKSQSRMDADYWNTAEDASLKAMQKETMAFNQAYMKKMGFEMTPDEAGRFGLAAAAAGMGASEDQLKPKLAALQKETAKMKGAPIVTEIKWFMESEEADAARKQARAREKTRAKDDDGVDVSGGASGMLGGFAAKMAKKKMQASSEKREAAQDGAPAFSSYSEIKAIKLADVPADSFQVPAGYKPVKD